MGQFFSIKFRRGASLLTVKHLIVQLNGIVAGDTRLIYLRLSLLCSERYPIPIAFLFHNQ